MAITLARSMGSVACGVSGSSVHGERQINSSRKQIIRMLGKLLTFLPLLQFYADI